MCDINKNDGKDNVIIIAITMLITGTIVMIT